MDEVLAEKLEQDIMALLARITRLERKVHELESRDES